MNEQAAIPPCSSDTGQPHQNGAGSGVRKTADAALYALADKEDGTESTFSQLCRLPFIEEDEDYTRPTAHAFVTALNLLLAARDLMYRRDCGSPRASFGTTDKGSVLVYWRKPGRSVQAVVPSQPMGDGFIQVMEGSTPTTHEGLEGQTLMILFLMTRWFTSPSAA